MRRLGFSNVRTMKVVVPHWVRGESRLTAAAGQIDRAAVDLERGGVGAVAAGAQLSQRGRDLVMGDELARIDGDRGAFLGRLRQRTVELFRAGCADGRGV